MHAGAPTAPDIAENVKMLAFRLSEMLKPGGIPLPNGVTVLGDGNMSIDPSTWAPMSRLYSSTPPVESFICDTVVANAGAVAFTTLFMANCGTYASSSYEKTVVIDGRALSDCTASSDCHKLNALAFFFYIFSSSPEEKTLAANVFRYAADQGDLHALYNFAVCLERGIGVDRNCKEAIKLYELI
jgi:TPR repeat protein